METIKIIQILTILIMIDVALLLFLNIIGFTKTEDKNIVNVNDVYGNMYTFEVPHKTQYAPRYIHIRTTERYDEKFLEYLDHIQEQRDKTFMRGRVFLRE